MFSQSRGTPRLFFDRHIASAGQECPSGPPASVEKAVHGYFNLSVDNVGTTRLPEQSIRKRGASINR